MKILVLLASVFTSSVFANPFDAFEGRYKLDGQVQVRKYNVDSCDRHGIPSLTGIEVKKDSNGYKQSHLIYINVPSGWNGIPVMQYEDRPDYLNPSVVYYSKVQGGKDLAQLIEGSNRDKFYSVKFLFERKAGKVLFKFDEEYLNKGVVEVGCYYQVELK